MRPRSDLGMSPSCSGPMGLVKAIWCLFFSMLNYMMTGALQTYIAEKGYADAFLYFGAKATRQIHAKLTFGDEQATDTYQFTLTQRLATF